MRQNYEPFADCISNPKIADEQRKLLAASQDMHILWAFEAVQMIVGLAYAYDTLKNNGSNISDLVKGINNELEKIRDKLDQVNRNLDRILDILLDLPRIMQGVVDASLVRQALGRCAGRVNIIQDKMVPGIFEQNINLIDQQCHEIQIEVAGIRGVSGVKGMLLAAPYFTIWLSARAAVEKEKLRRDPTRVRESPWELSWTKDVRSLFGNVFTQAEFEDLTYEGTIIPRVPPHMERLIVDAGSFKRTSLGGPISPKPKNEYRLTCPFGTAGSEKLEYLQPALKPTNPAVWVPVKPTDNYHTDAIAAHGKVQDVRNELVAFYSLMPKLFAERSALMRSFEEPSGFWQA